MIAGGEVETYNLGSPFPYTFVTSHDIFVLYGWWDDFARAVSLPQ